MLSYFLKKTSTSPKFIIDRNGVIELTLSLDCSSTVADLRRRLSERLPDLSENEQFIHSNGAPIHILDEQDTLVSELLQDNSNIIFLKTKLPTGFMTTSDSMASSQNRNVHNVSNMQRNSQQALVMSNATRSHPSNVDTITVKKRTETKSVRLSDLLSSDRLELDIDSLSPADMKRIVLGLKQNKKVHHLTIKSGYCHVIKILVEVLQINQTLTHLYISDYLNDADCILLANALNFNKTLRNLNLRQNKITSVGCEAIGEMLKTNKSLTHLNICRNKLQDAGIKLICEALMVNQTLSDLDIYQTRISIQGCAMVAEMLRINQTLTLLDIGDNNLGDNGITMIANALKDNNTLIELDSKWNKITEKGALALVDTLRTNRTLTTVKLQFNCMPEDVKIEINKEASQLKTTGLGICWLL